MRAARGCRVGHKLLTYIALTETYGCNWDMFCMFVAFVGQLGEVVVRLFCVQESIFLLNPDKVVLKTG